MSFLCALAAFLLIQRLKKTLKLTPLYLKWKTLFAIGSGGVLVLGFVIMSQFGEPLNDFAGGAILLGLLLYVLKEEDFRPLKTFFESHYPLVAAVFLNGLVRLVMADFYKAHHSYFQFAAIGAFIWIYARQANTRKQQEELKIIAERNMRLDTLVAERTAELTKQKNELEETVKLLQATQAQLIQQEKLASLGELTAGIAHEIQNPLNFVNNFAEVSMELIDEMEEELNNGDKEEAFAIAADIKQNLEKIRHHGKRADGIVKGMLQHSRASSDTKEPTDVNALADEYLRLAYHGLRAKDKSFNAELVTHYAADLPRITIVPQDIGRVLLNLFTNAFYAVQQRKKAEGNDFKPTVELTTQFIGGTLKGDDKKLIITVKDNGTGIPDAIKEKIMQPFFTTKPTGEGTGLGLSLSYDIVVKGHGGNIALNTKEGEYTEFVITLPV